MNAAVELLEEKFPDEVVEVVEFRGETTIVVKPERIGGHLPRPCGMTAKTPASSISP